VVILAIGIKNSASEPTISNAALLHLGVRQKSAERQKPRL